MPENKSPEKKRRYRSDGTPIWSKRAIDGPGVWVTCVKGKEKQVVGEVYDLFESVAEEMWPEDQDAGGESKKGDDEDGGEMSLEVQIAQEVAAMKRPRRKQRFANCQTNTPCVIFISCKKPVDPVALVVKHVEEVVRTGVTRTRYTQRLTPVADSCVANLPEIRNLCRRVILPVFEPESDRSYTYKIELRMINHNTLSKGTVLQEIAKLIPEGKGHKVDLKNPEVFVLVEVFKSVCGMSVVKDYYRLQKFNIMEIAKGKKGDVEFKEGQSRVGDSVPSGSKEGAESLTIEMTAST